MPVEYLVSCLEWIAFPRNSGYVAVCFLSVQSPLYCGVSCSPENAVTAMFRTEVVLITWNIVSGWCLSQPILYTTERLATMSALLCCMQ
jgi:hypothetical protein